MKLKPSVPSSSLVGLVVVDCRKSVGDGIKVVDDVSFSFVDAVGESF